MEQEQINVDELDPYSPDLTQEQMLAIVERAKNDSLYYLIKVISPTIQPVPHPSVIMADVQYKIIDGLRVLHSASNVFLEDGKRLIVTEFFRPQPEKENRINSMLQFYKDSIKRNN